MKKMIDMCVDCGAFQSQRILGYYIHSASKPASKPITDISNAIDCLKSKRVVEDEELELMQVSNHPTEIDHIPLNSLLNENGQCYLVIRLQGDRDKDIFRTLFELDINDLRSYGFNIIYQIYSFLKTYHNKTLDGEKQAYGPFLSDIDTDRASIRVHRTFQRDDRFNNVRAKFWFKSRLLHNVGIKNTKRTVENDLNDFCLLANRIMFRIFEDEYPVAGKTYPDWSSLDERIRLMDQRDKTFLNDSNIREHKESIFAFLIICSKLKTFDFSSLEKLFKEYEGKTYNNQIPLANKYNTAI